MGIFFDGVWYDNDNTIISYGVTTSNIDDTISDVSVWPSGTPFKYWIDNSGIIQKCEQNKKPKINEKLKKLQEIEEME